MAINKETLEKVNYYAKLSKERELTSEEKKQQDKVRKQYLAQFRSGMKQMLDNVDVLKQITVAKSYEEVHAKYHQVDGIHEIKAVGFNMTEITYNVKVHDAKTLLISLQKK